MNRTGLKRVSCAVSLSALLTMVCLPAHAVYFFWTDWTTQLSSTHFQGTITTSNYVVTVDYTNYQGVAFFQASGGTDYWKDGNGLRDPSVSPFTGDTVDNIPTGTDIIALSQAGFQGLTFSQEIANPVFSYVSLNGNGYAFLDQDFDILSYGDGVTNNAGIYGAGTSYKAVTNLGNGHIEYQLLGTGEPHGTIQFHGTFSNLVWRSMSPEYWNGFTLGIQGTAVEVVPEPAVLSLMAIGLTGMWLCFRGNRCS